MLRALQGRTCAGWAWSAGGRSTGLWLPQVWAGAGDTGTGFGDDKWHCERAAVCVGPQPV